MYEIFVNLLIENNKKAIDVSKATGIPASTFSDWKKGRSVPKQDKLQKIADFFRVSVDYLMTGKEPEEDFSDDFGLSDAKKKHIVELINLLSE